MSENISTISNNIWSLANVLRDDGVGNTKYLQQITYLLFLKLVDEYTKPPYNRDLNLPEGCSWDDLVKKDGAELNEAYENMLKVLSLQSGILGEMYAGSRNEISKPTSLKKVISLINNENWSSLGQDVKGVIYEDLLQKVAEDTKSGAGQYFTPRPLINTIVKCVQPKPDKTICDPACGSGGFLLSSYQYITNCNDYILDRGQKEKLKYETFYGVELVRETYQECLMNLFLHGIGDLVGDKPISIECTDSLLSKPNRLYDYVLANPPFGRKSSYSITNNQGEEDKEEQTYSRQDFWTVTSNKQLNFLQHIYSILKKDGRAAVVLPDNVLFEMNGGGDIVRRKLLELTNVHTILRLPTGIFYKQGVKANVVFFDNKPASGEFKTKEVWVYDYRTGIHHTLKQKPLNESDLDDFIDCYNPNNINERVESYSEKTPDGRWRRFSIEEIANNNYNLDLKWLEQDDSIDDRPLNEIFELIKVKSEIILQAISRLEILLTSESNIEFDDIINPRNYKSNHFDLGILLNKSITKVLELAVAGELIPTSYEDYYEQNILLGDVLIYEQPTKFIVESTNYNDSYSTPVLTAGKTFILGNTNENSGIKEASKTPVVIFDDFTTATKYVDFDFKVKSSAMKILNPNTELIDPYFSYLLLQTIKVNSDTHKRYWISEYAPIEIRLLKKEVQLKIIEKVKRIMSLFDIII